MDNISAPFLLVLRTFPSLSDQVAVHRVGDSFRPVARFVGSAEASLSGYVSPLEHREEIGEGTVALQLTKTGDISFPCRPARRKSQ